MASPFIDPAAARAYLLSTVKSPGASMLRQGISTAIGRLNPVYAVRLATAIQNANEAGMNVGVSSAYRRPGDTGTATSAGRFDAAGKSLHSYGLATDLSGISSLADTKKFRQFATEAGIYNPYSLANAKEWNHFQAIPQKSAPQQMRSTITADGPIDLSKMWDAAGLDNPGTTYALAEPKPDRMAGGIDASSPDYWRPDSATAAVAWEGGKTSPPQMADDNPLAYALATPSADPDASKAPIDVTPDHPLSHGLFGLANRSGSAAVQKTVSGLSGLFGLNPRNIGSAAPIGGTPTDVGVRTMAQRAGYATSAATPDGYTAPTFDKRLGGSTYAYKYDPVTKKGTYINEFGRLIHYGG